MRVIILGAGAIGAHLADLFSKINQDIVVIDDDDQKLERIQENCDLMTVHSSSNSPIKAMKDAKVGNADLFIAVTRDEYMNLSQCVLAHSLGASRTVAKVENRELTAPQVVNAFSRAGVSSVIDPDNLAALDIVNSLKMTWVRQRWDVHGGALTLLGIKAWEGCEILNIPFKQVFKPDSPYHVVAIKRGNDTIIPTGDDMIKTGDLVYFMTTRENVPSMKKIMGKSHYPDVKNVIIVGGGRTAVRVVNMLPDGIRAKPLLRERDEALRERRADVVRLEDPVHDLMPLAAFAEADSRVLHAIAVWNADAHLDERKVAQCVELPCEGRFELLV